MSAIQDIQTQYTDLVTAIYAHNGVEAEAKRVAINSALTAYTDEIEANPLTDAERVFVGHMKDWIHAHVEYFQVPDDYGKNIRAITRKIGYYQDMICRTYLNLLSVEAERIEKIIILILSYEIEDNNWYAFTFPIYGAGIQLYDLFLNAIALDKLEREIERINGK